MRKPVKRLQRIVRAKWNRFWYWWHYKQSNLHHEHYTVSGDERSNFKWLRHADLRHEHYARLYLMGETI